MASRFGLFVLVMIILLLLTYFAYKAAQDDYSSGFLAEIRDSGFMIGRVVTKALSGGESTVIRIEELIDKNETNLTEEERKKTIVIS